MDEGSAKVPSDPKLCAERMQRGLRKFCLADHRGYINNQDETQATGKHFNSPGHSLADLSKELGTIWNTHLLHIRALVFALKFQSLSNYAHEGREAKCIASV